VGIVEPIGVTVPAGERVAEQTPDDLSDDLRAD
jgi:hypothetical protein